MHRIVKLSLFASQDEIERITTDAVATLQSGGIVALPTDTLYGVASLMSHSNKLYELKRRPSSKPLGVYLASATDVFHWAEVTMSSEILHKLLPGPVTLVFRKLRRSPDCFNMNVETIAVRVPESRIVNELCRAVGEPLAHTSANISGSTMNPTSVLDFEELHEQIDLIIDAGEIESAATGSTIVDLCESGHFRIVRDGCALEDTVSKLRAAGLIEINNEMKDR